MTTEDKVDNALYGLRKLASAMKYLAANPYRVKGFASGSVPHRRSNYKILNLAFDKVLREARQ